MMFLYAILFLALSINVPLKKGEPISINESEVKVNIPLTVISGLAVDADYVYLTTDAGLFVIPKDGGNPLYFGAFEGIIPPWLTGIAVWRDNVYLSTDMEGMIYMEKGTWKPKYVDQLAWKTSILECQANEDWLLLTGKPRRAYYAYLIPRKTLGKAKLVPTLFGKERCTLMGDTVFSYSPEGKFIRVYLPSNDTTWTIPFELEGKNARPSIIKITSYKREIWVLLDASLLYEIKNPASSPKAKSITLPKGQHIWDFDVSRAGIALAADSGVFIGSSDSWNLIEKVPRVRRVSYFENGVWFATNTLVGKVGAGEPIKIASLIKNKRINVLDGSSFNHMYLSGPFYGEGAISHSIPFLKKGLRPIGFNFFFGVIGIKDSVIPLLKSKGRYTFGRLSTDGTLEPDLAIPGKRFNNPVVADGIIWGMGKKGLLSYNQSASEWDSVILNSMREFEDTIPTLRGHLKGKLLLQKGGVIYLFEPKTKKIKKIPIPVKDTSLSIPVASGSGDALIGSKGRMDLVDTMGMVISSYIGDSAIYYNPLLLRGKYAIISNERPRLDFTIPQGTYLLDLKTGVMKKIQRGPGLLSTLPTGVELIGDTLWIATRCGISSFPYPSLLEGAKQ